MLVDADVSQLTVPELVDVRDARARIAPYVRRTPAAASHAVGRRLGTNAYLKLEMFQKTGAFKVRGAFNRILAMRADERRRGVVAASAGNHGQAVAYVARALGIPAIVVMPETTPLHYLEAAASYGATLHLTATIADALNDVAQFIGQGYTFVHPYADPYVIAGQGTIGLEILDDVPDVTDVVVSIGGGGLAGGVALAVKSLCPHVRVWGVETAGAETMSLAFAAGRPVELPRVTSIARTLGAPIVAGETFALAQRYLESITVVSDAATMDALRFLLQRVKVLTEPASSCTLAAAEELREHFTSDSRVVLILCGGNAAVSDINAGAVWTGGLTRGL